MAQLSILPGRFRLEYPLLVGRPEVCSDLDQRLMEFSGVRETCSNPRTGRVLVRFDEGAVRGEDLLRRIEELLNGLDRWNASPVPLAARGRNVGAGHDLSSRVTRSLLWDAVAHALLPSPLDLLLPTALAAFRR